MITSIGAAMEQFVRRMLAGEVVPITKRVPCDLAFYYLANGWVEHEREGRIVTLIWPHEGIPP